MLAQRDGLTGCLNHRSLHQRLDVEALLVEPDAPLSLLLVDVDEFKRINDTYGHPAGDRVLQLVGEHLGAVGEGVAGRLGGDEFALLLPGSTAAQAGEVGERIRDHVRTCAVALGVTLSVGVASTARRGDGAGLLAAADRALYDAKRAGRNRVAVDGAARLPAPRLASA